MKKTGKYGMSAETITLKTIKYIRDGYTWNEVAELMSYSKGYLQSLCKAHYKRESSYKASWKWQGKMPKGKVQYC